MKLRYRSMRRLFQFRLRTFLLMVLAAGLISGWIANAKAHRDQELGVIHKLMTASSKAPYEVVHQAVGKGSQANGPLAANFAGIFT